MQSPTRSAIYVHLPPHRFLVEIDVDGRGEVAVVEEFLNGVRVVAACDSARCLFVVVVPDEERLLPA